MVRVRALGNRVPALAAPRVAAADSADGEPGSSKCSMHLKSLHGVGRAGGLEATRRRPTRANLLVEHDAAPHHARREAHGASRPNRRASSAASSLFTSFLSSSGSRSNTSGPAETSSTPAGTEADSSPAKSATTARNRRRSRLRWTAPPTRLVIAYATRVPAAPSSARKVSASGPRRTRIPRARNATKVRRSRTGRIKPTAWPDPSDGGSAARHGRPWWTSACGSHGSWPACGRWAERCASLLSSSGSRARARLRRPPGVWPLDVDWQPRRLRAEPSGQRYVPAAPRGNRGPHPR